MNGYNETNHGNHKIGYESNQGNPENLNIETVSNMFFVFRHSY